MQQNSFEIEIPHSPTLLMGSYASANIAHMIHEEIVLLFGLGGCAPEGSEPLIDPDMFIFPEMELSDMTEFMRLFTSADPSWSELLDERAAA